MCVGLILKRGQVFTWVPLSQKLFIEAQLFGAGKMPQRLRGLPALAEDIDLVPSTTQWLTADQFLETHALFRLPPASRTHMGAYTHKLTKCYYV